MGEQELGFAESFATLWERHQAVVYQGCLSWTGGRRDDADEAFGRVALHALQRYPQRFRDPQHARAWLLTLARNVCMDMHRQRRRRNEVSLEGTVLDAPAAHDPESSLLARETGLRFRAAMAVLPPRLRHPAALHFVDQMQYRDIARQLGITEVAVRKRMQQARDLLRSSIETSAPAVAGTATERVHRAEDAVLACIVVTTRGGVERDAELLLESLHARGVERIRRYIDAHPGGWRKRLELARAYVAAGDVEAALEHYRYVVERQPFPLAPWLELGAALEVLDAGDEAAEVYERGARAVGRAEDAEQLRARAEGGGVDAGAARKTKDLAQYDALLAAGRLRAAAELIAASAQRDANAAALERLIASRACAGDIDVARELRTLRRLAPERAGTHYAAALAALARGDAEDAHEILAAYLARHPRHAGAWRMFADVRLRTGRDDAAMRAALTATALEPKSRDAWLVLLHAARTASTVEAQRIADDATRRFSRDPFILSAAGALHAAKARSGCAVTLCARSVALEPEIPRLRLRLAQAFARNGNDAEALAEVRAAWTLSPGDDCDRDAAIAAMILSEHCARANQCGEAAAWTAVAERRLDALHALDRAAAQRLRARIAAQT